MTECNPPLQVPFSRDASRKFRARNARRFSDTASLHTHQRGERDWAGVQQTLGRGASVAGRESIERTELFRVISKERDGVNQAAIGFFPVLTD